MKYLKNNGDKITTLNKSFVSELLKIKPNTIIENKQKSIACLGN